MTKHAYLWLGVQYPCNGVLPEFSEWNLLLYLRNNHFIDLNSKFHLNMLNCLYSEAILSAAAGSCLYLSWIHTQMQSAFFIPLLHAHFRFWGHERLIDRSISKRHLESDAASWVEKSSTSGVFHARDTGFYWSSKNALHEGFIASSGIWVWMKMLQLIAQHWKKR